MAVTQENLLIEISANTAKASQAIDQLTLSLADIDNKLKQSNKSQKESSKSLNDFGMIASKAAGVIAVAKEAFNALGGVISATVGEFQKAQTGVQSLADTLAMMGEKNVTKSLDRFLNLADQIQNTTIVDDDTVISLAKLGVAAGRTDDQIEKMVKTAVNMAAVTGGDVKRAMDELSASFTGEVGSLAKLNPELKNLTQAQIQAGAAVDLLAKKFEGAGVTAAQSYQGQLAQIQNKTSDVMEEIGRILSKGFGLEESTKNLNKVMGYVVDAIKSAGPQIAQGLAFIKAVFDDVFNGITYVIWETIKTFWKFVENFANIADRMGSLFGSKLGFGDFTRSNIEQLRKLQEHIVGSLVNPLEAAAKAKEAYGKDVVPQVSAQSGSERRPSQVMSNESKQALEELRKKAEEFQKQNMLAGQSEFAQIKIKAKLELDELDIIENKLRLQNSLNAAAKANLETARQAIKIRSTKDESAAYKKEFEDLNKQRTALERSNASVGKTPYQAAVEDQKRQLEDIEKQRAKFQEEGKLPKSGPFTPDQQKLSDELKATRTAIESQQKLGNSDSFNQAKDVGDQIAGKMTSALQGPVMGSIMGAMSGAMSVISVAQGVVDMAQQLVDAIPKLLNSFANLINSIVELPLKIAEGIGNILNAVMNVIKNLIPNLIQSVINIVDHIRNFIREAPKQFMMMVDKSVEMLTNFIDDLPNIVQEMAQNLTEAIPKIMGKSIEFAMVGAPKIMMRLIKVIYTELPPAIWHGIMEGMKEFGRVFQRWMKGDFSGEKIKIDVDTKAVQKQLSNLTKDASRLFSVTAIADAAKNATNEAKKIDEAAKKAGKNMWQAFLDAMVKAWHNFLKAGGEIWNGLMTAIGNIAETFGEWGTAIWNGFILPIANWFGDRGTEIWNGFLLPVATWFGDRGTEIWNGFILPIATWFGDRGTEVWDGFIKPVAEWFGDRGTEIWNGFFKPIGETFANFGTAIFNSFTKPLKDLKLPTITLPDVTNFKLPKITLPDTSNFKLPTISLPDPGLQEFRDKFYRLGSDIWNGLWSGISSFDWGSLIPAIGGGGGGGVLGKVFGSTGGYVTNSGIEYFASGGFARGNDSIPAMLTPGEFILKTSAVNKIGVGNLLALNNGKAQLGSQTSNVTVNLTVNTSEKLDESFIRQRLMPAIRDELKRNSLDGRTIVYAGGVRK